jgi:outer membrane protein TolC
MATSRPRRRPVLVALAAALLAAVAPLDAQQRLTLRESIALAQRQGLAAQAARSALDAARWRERSYRADLLPQLRLVGDAPNVYRSITPIIQPNGTTVFAERSEMQSSMSLQLSQRIPQTGGELFIESGLTRVDRFGGEASRIWQSTPFAVGIRQGILRPNALRWNRREQGLQAEIAERQYAEAHEQVAEMTAGAFFDVWAADVAVANAAANAAVNDTLYTLNTGRFDVGKIGENDLLQSELALLRARNALDAARLDRERAAAALRRLLALPADAPIEISPPTEVSTVTVDPAVAVAEASRNRARVGEHELLSLQARRRVSEARLYNGFGADVIARAGFNQTSSILGDAYRSLLDQQTLEVGIQMPLVQWGGGRADVEAARAEQERVASTVRAERLALEEEARFAALELEQAKRQLAIAAKADTVAARRFDVAKNRYVIGKIDIGALYIAQSEKDAAVAAYVQALRGYWVAFYRLRRLTLYDFATGSRVGGEG